MNPTRILLCDDERYIVRAAEVMFRRAGFEVQCASDGEQAWQMILERRPDIVITDCQMPRLDGLGLAERIDGDPDLSGLPVIMLTGKSCELNHAELRQNNGVLAVLAKPFSPRELLQRVEVVLHSREPEPALA